MGPLMHLIYLAVFMALNYRSTVGQLKTCYKYNPLSINETQPPSELRCPDRCNCSYCIIEGKPLLQYQHNTHCSNLQFKAIPPNNTVPIDARSYILDKNDISFLKNDSFKTSLALEYLSLNDNKLTYKTIELDAFRGLRKLKYLSLNGNINIYRLRTNWFLDLVSLESLHLRDCGITTLTSDVFKHSDKLRVIELTTNEIPILPATVFQNLHSLTMLFISDNHVDEIPYHAFAGCNELQTMHLDGNSLATISEDVGLQALEKLKFLKLSHNHFLCDCNLIWFRRWLDNTSVSLQDIGHTKCFSYRSKVYKKLMDFDPDILQCNTLTRALMIAIPLALVGFAIIVIGLLVYYFRYDLRYWNQRRRLRKQYQKLDTQGPPPINGLNIRYDAFVSYNSKDQQWILSVLHPSLESQRNFKLCLDYRDFIPGAAIVDNIADAVKYSRKVLLIVSKNFAKSEWCYFELEMARMRMFDNHEDILVVVLLEKVSAKDMPILLHKIVSKKTYIQWEEHPDKQALFWTKLEAALLSPNCPRERLLDIPQNIGIQET